MGYLTLLNPPHPEALKSPGVGEGALIPGPDAITGKGLQAQLPRTGARTAMLNSTATPVPGLEPEPHEWGVLDKIISVPARGTCPRAPACPPATAPTSPGYPLPTAVPARTPLPHRSDFSLCLRLAASLGSCPATLRPCVPGRAAPPRSWVLEPCLSRSDFRVDARLQGRSRER